MSVSNAPATLGFYEFRRFDCFPKTVVHRALHVNETERIVPPDGTAQHPTGKTRPGVAIMLQRHKPSSTQRCPVKVANPAGPPNMR